MAESRCTDRQLRTIIPVCLMLGFISPPSLASWNPEDTETCFTSGDLLHGGQLAVAETRFLPSGSESPQSMRLIAVTDGAEHIRLYSLDTSGQTAALDFEDEAAIAAQGIIDPIAFTPTFMELIIDQTAEPCLVVPVLSEDDTGGSISIVRLTSRDIHGQLAVLNNCFDCNGELSYYRDLYYVADLTELASPTYAISITRQPVEEPLENYILYAEFDSSADDFVATGSFILPSIYYGDQDVAVATRPWVTKLQEFEYGTETDGPLCYTTANNGGVFIWDPADGESPDIYWVSVSQFGTWIYDDEAVPPVMGELGDVHRAVILEGAEDQYFEELGDITVDNRLMFFADFTMGFMVCDVSRPTRPQHVWQWDCDLRPCEEEDEDWDWHGAGHMTFDTMDQADAGTFPAETFGIGVSHNIPLAATAIHLYLAGGIDGLRCFDLTEFLDPFGVGEDTESNYDDFSIDIYDEYVVSGQRMRAYDLQTLSVGDDTFVFTSWKRGRTGTDAIGLTVHRDEDVVCD